MPAAREMEGKEVTLPSELSKASEMEGNKIDTELGEVLTKAEISYSQNILNKIMNMNP